jgi:hypothetical protein
MANKLTKQQFIDKAINIHDKKYDYSKVKYLGSQIKIIIVCPKHGEFLQIPNNHLCGKGCKKCNHKMPTTREFIKKARYIHKRKYNYSKTKYINKTKKIIIICPSHDPHTIQQTF